MICVSQLPNGLELLVSDRDNAGSVMKLGTGTRDNMDPLFDSVTAVTDIERKLIFSFMFFLFTPEELFPGSLSFH